MKRELIHKSDYPLLVKRRADAISNILTIVHTKDIPFSLPKDVITYTGQVGAERYIELAYCFELVIASKKKRELNADRTYFHNTENGTYVNHCFQFFWWPTGQQFTQEYLDIIWNRVMEISNIDRILEVLYDHEYGIELKNTRGDTMEYVGIFPNDSNEKILSCINKQIQQRKKMKILFWIP